MTIRQDKHYSIFDHDMKLMLDINTSYSSMHSELCYNGLDIFLECKYRSSNIQV